MAEQPVRRRAVRAPEAPAPTTNQQRVKRHDVKPETRHAIGIVILLTTAAVALMSVFGWAGSLGDQFSKLLGTLFGWERYLVSFVLLFIGAVLLFPEWVNMTTARWTGLGFIFGGSLGILQFFSPVETAVSRAIDGIGGGYIGVIVSQPLRLAFGPWASGVILVGFVG
jgi:hypothetical protein